MLANATVFLPSEAALEALGQEGRDALLEDKYSRSYDDDDNVHDDNVHDDDDDYDDGDIYIMVKCLSVCLSVSKSHYFCIQRIWVFLLFLDTFRIQIIWSFLLFIDTFRIQDI